MANMIRRKLESKMAKTGKSIGEGLPFGKRRTALDNTGKVRVLAPRYFRKMGRHYMDDVTDSEIAEVYFNKDFALIERMTKKAVQTAKGQITRLTAKLDALEERDDNVVLRETLKADIDAWKAKIAESESAESDVRSKVAAYRLG